MKLERESKIMLTFSHYIKLDLTSTEAYSEAVQEELD